MMPITPTGIQVGRMRVPLGVIGIIYESRPNVTVDAAALCLKAGNACILRGGSDGPNYSTADVGAAIARLGKAKQRPRLMVDCSHGNSSKDHEKQPAVVSELCESIAGGDRSVFGVMLESFLVAGRQDLKDPSKLKYGQSITDACMSWDTTAVCLEELSQAVRKRRG